jgi:hypothetical protein
VAHDVGERTVGDQGNIYTQGTKVRWGYYFNRAVHETTRGAAG